MRFSSVSPGTAGQASSGTRLFQQATRAICFAIAIATLSTAASAQDAAAAVAQKKAVKEAKFRAANAAVALAQAKAKIAVKVAAADIKPDKKPTDTPKAKDAPAKDAPKDAPPVKPIDPEIIRFFLSDGSIVTGKLKIKEITVTTEFGDLKVPVSEIRSITPGLVSFPEILAKLTTLIRDLAAEDFKSRDAAEKALLKMGGPYRTELRHHLSDPSQERVSRLRKILAKLDEKFEEDIDFDDENENTAHVVRHGDAVVAKHFTIVGKVSPQEFVIESKYGALTVKLSDVKFAKRNQVESGDIRKAVVVDGLQHIIQRGMKSSGIRLEKGDQVTVSARGQIVLPPWGSSALSTPEGAANYGTHPGGNKIYVGTLAAKIGDDGELIRVGSKASFKADRRGVLQFGIGMHQSYARGNYQFAGQYNLVVRVKRATNNAAPPQK